MDYDRSYDHNTVIALATRKWPWPYITFEILSGHVTIVFLLLSLVVTRASQELRDAFKEFDYLWAASFSFLLITWKSMESQNRSSDVIGRHDDTTDCLHCNIFS